MTRALALLVCVGGVLAAPSVQAQTIRGTLVEQRSGDAVPAALVQLLDAAGTVIDSARSSAAGTFVLAGRNAGEYYLLFAQPGYASVPSDRLRLEAGRTLEHRFAVPLISGAALRRMSEVIDVEKRLQTDLADLCGEPPRPWEAGILVGVVRRHPRGEALSGAIVRVSVPVPGAARFERATVSSANGVYVICNVPPGTVTTRTELAGFTPDEGPADLRAGEIAWYDVYLRAARRR